MSNITSSLYRQLRNTLLNCGPFANSADLKAVFVDARISNWRDSLPDATNAVSRVNTTIDFLSRQFNVAGENALVLLLYVLSEQKELGDTCYHQLVTLANQLQQQIKLSDTITSRIETDHVLLNNESPRQEKEIQEMTKTQKPKLDKTQIIVAVIAAVAAIVAAYWQFVWKPTNIDKPFQYAVRVEDLNAGEAISRAQVTVEIIGKAPLNAVSDSNGIARIFIDGERVGEPGRLRVERIGYTAYREDIDLKKDTLPDIVQLKKLP